MLSIAIALFAPVFASQCDSSDDKIWKTKTSVGDNFKSELTHCALMGGGQNPVTGDCMSRSYGYSQGCGQCFGKLTSCTMMHCVICETQGSSKACSDCEKTKCAVFTDCTGWQLPEATPPMNELEAPLASQCTAADAAIWASKGKASFESTLSSCGHQCFGGAKCTGECVSKAEGYTEACGMCFGTLTHCSAHNCMGKCAFTPNSQGCKRCVDENCTPAFESCTGFTVPSYLAWLKQVKLF